MNTVNEQKRVLLVMSSYDDMGISGKQTGTWFTEVAAPYYILTEAGYEVVFASPEGGEAPIDLLSMKTPFTTEYTDRFLNDPVATFATKRTRVLRNIDYNTFDAVFVPGGYGLLTDLASDQHLIKLIKDFYETDRPIAMVCHAPAILRDVKLSNGKFLVDGVNLTGFKDAEDAEKQEKCKEGSKDRNQGLQYVNEKEHKQKTNSLQKISSLALSLLIKSWVVQKH